MWSVGWKEIPFLEKLLLNFGYFPFSGTDRVHMFKIINLPMLLTELSPLISKRLKNSDYRDWHGKIGIAGEQSVHERTLGLSSPKAWVECPKGVSKPVSKPTYQNPRSHKASIIIKDGEINVSEEVSEDVDILISANYDTITRIIVGNLTPFQAYLQTFLSIQPMVNDKVTSLLDTIFPRIPKQE